MLWILEKSTFLLFGTELTLSLLMTALECLEYIADQDQIAQNVQSDLWFILSIFCILDFN